MAFDWTPSVAADSALPFGKILPVEVLYDFDGPILFTAAQQEKILLCYKIDEDDQQHSQYIVVPTNSRVIESVRNGSMSLRFAMFQAWSWVVEANSNFVVSRSWQLDTTSIPESYFPEKGYGLSPEHGIISERLANGAKPFLSIHFKGGALGGLTMPFGTLVGLLNDVFNTTSKIFVPAIHDAAPGASEKIIRKALSMPIYEPSFGSLLIEMNEPRIDLSHIRNRPDINIDLAKTNIAKANDEFLRAVDDITSAAQQNRLTKGRARESLDVLDAMAQLVPNDRTLFDVLVVQGRGLESNREMTIDSETGQRIRTAYDETATRYRTVNGKIVEVSSRSGSFIIRTHNSREITCRATLDTTKQEVSTLRNGMRVTVKGNFERRTRRDFLWLDSFETTPS